MIVKFENLIIDTADRMSVHIEMCEESNESLYEAHYFYLRKRIRNWVNTHYQA